MSAPRHIAACQNCEDNPAIVGQIRTIAKNAKEIEMRILISIILICISFASSGQEHASMNSKLAELAVAKTPSHETESRFRKSTQHSQKIRHIGPASLGVSFSNFLSQFEYDHTKVSEGMLYVYKDGKPMFGLSDKSGLKDRIVRDVEIISPSITCEKGIHVGMPVEELLKQFPGLELQISHEDGVEYFEPTELQKLNPKFPDVTVLINVSSKNGAPLGSGNLWEYPTRRYRTSGEISTIDIFRTDLHKPMPTHNQESK